MAKAKVVDPRVQEWYDALPEQEKLDFNNKLIELNRTLAEMRWSVSTKGLDKRMLFPKVVIPNRQTMPELFDNDDAPENFENAKDKSKASGHRLRIGEKLPEGKDLGSYIKSQLGDGKALADFYIDILAMNSKEARRAGVWMNHKLESAKWLAERGWGKVGTDSGEKAPTTIQIINYGEAPTQPAPVRENVAEDVLAAAEEDAGKDKPREDDPYREVGMDQPALTRKEVEIEGDLDFLRDDNA